MEESTGTIVILGEKVPDEVKCPFNCDGGDVTVNTKTGICKVCKRVFPIQSVIPAE